MKIRAKYIASRPFSCAGYTFSTGDAVEGVALGAALRFGDEFVTSDTSRRRKATEPNTVPEVADTDQEVTP